MCILRISLSPVLAVSLLTLRVGVLCKVVIAGKKWTGCQRWFLVWEHQRDPNRYLMDRL